MTTNLSELAQQHLDLTLKLSEAEASLYPALTRFAEFDSGRAVHWVGNLEWSECGTLKLSFRSSDLRSEDDSWHMVGFSFFNDPDAYIDKAHREKVANQEKDAVSRQEDEKRHLRALLEKYPDVKP